MARTHASIHTFILACVAALIISAGMACENTARGLKQDAQAAEERTRDDRAEATERARALGGDAAHAARNVGEAASEAGEKLAEHATAVWETIDIKAALMADSTVDAARIDVETDARTRTVKLSGYVPTHTERDMAEVIAKAHAEGYTVINQIAVQPRKE